MQILQSAKNNKPLDSNLTFAIINILEIQILTLFFLNIKSPIFSNVLKFIEKKSAIQSLVIIIFTLNLIQLFFIIFKLILSQRNGKKINKAQSSTFLYCLQIKPYLTIVQIINICSIGLISSNVFCNVLSLFNIIFCSLELLAFQIITVSYRFIEKNHIRRKNNSILPWLFIMPIVFTLHFYDEKYASIFLLLRALTQLYFNFNNLENEEIRFCEWFFPLISIELTFIIFANFYLNLSIFSNVSILIFTIIFTVYSCSNISKFLSVYVIKYHLKSCSQLMESDNQDNSIKGGQIQINDSQLHKSLLHLRILVKIYFSQQNNASLEKNNGYHSDNFDNWWNFYNRLILDHRVYCQNVTCQCNKFQFMKCKDNQEIEKKLFAEKIYSVIKKLQIESSASVNKLKIIENYFLIEMEKKPMKTYYQLIKIEKDKLNRQETLEVENLIHETRDTFTQLFLRQKVQNTDLNIEPLFQFQDHLKDMRSRLNNMAVEYRLFYEVFANNFVQMQALKQKTRLLTEFKNQFSQEIDFCLKKFDKSLQLMTFCMVYFRFFDEYTNKLQKVEEKAQYLIEAFKIPFSETKRGTVDIFDPHYGAVKADLVFNPGKIITITKNLCHTLGFTHQQLAGQKINKMMPTMFSRNHDKFLRTFVEKGSLKMLKFKENIYYARSVNKFIMPITIRLKVDYTNSDSFYAVTFMRPTQTKSEFILMNNYGKVQEITSGLYKKLFSKALGDEITRVKRLCITKLLLSLNYLLKDLNKITNDQVYDGMILSSQDQQTLMSYYKFPQLKKVYKNKNQNGEESSRTSRSVQGTYSSGEGSRSMDFSEDVSKYSVDLKQSLKNYFKDVDISKVNGFRVSYRFQDYVTNQFKCKVLQILSIRQQISGTQLGVYLRQQISEVAQFMGIEKQDLSEFSIMKKFNQLAENSVKSAKKTKIIHQKQQSEKSGSFQKIAEYKTTKFLNDAEQSQQSSMIKGNDDKKKKQTIISAFEQKIIINDKLQLTLTILIFLMAFILILVCNFSLQLKGNYQNLQNDNMIITNFRINFLLRIAIQQMQQIYDTYELQVPSFISQKKNLLTDRMKQLLKNSIEWIGLSSSQYENTLTMKDSKLGFNRTQSVMGSLQTVYSTFLMAQTRGYYIIDNYIVINSILLALTDKQIVSILEMSNFYNFQIHLVVAAYATVLVALCVVLIWLRKISLQKQDKIIDFLPFLKSFRAKRMALFFEKFFQYNKDVEGLNLYYIQDLALRIQNANQTKKFNQTQKSQQNFQKSLKNNSNQQNNESRLIRVVKNQKSGITLKIVLFALIVIGLCLFVIFFSEYFFLEANNKFTSYVQLKSDSFLVQLIPSRIILLYFINFHYIINNQSVNVMPQSFITNVHDRTFEYQKDTSSPTYYGTEMQEVMRQHFTTNICNLISCSQNFTSASQMKNQQVFYLSYRYLNAFNYLRKIVKMLPNDKDPKGTMKKWIDQNNAFEILNSLDFILDLMKKNESEISELFTNQIVQIGYILLALSLTLIPILILIMMFGRNKYMEFISQKLECTENIYKHISWPILSQNTYASNYFENKLKTSKKY